MILHSTNDVCEVLFKYPLYDVVLVRDGVDLIYFTIVYAYFVCAICAMLLTVIYLCAVFVG
jgi:hypothetical protein